MLTRECGGCECKKDLQLVEVKDDNIVVFKCEDPDVFDECKEKETLEMYGAGGLSMLSDFVCPCIADEMECQESNGQMGKPHLRRLVFSEMQQRNMGRDHHQYYIYQCTCSRHKQFVKEVLLQPFHEYERARDAVVEPKLRAPRTTHKKADEYLEEMQRDADPVTSR